MTLALNPRLPLLWRTPDSLQLGLDDPPVVLTEVTTAHERMLTALAVGLTPEGLVLIGTESGLRPEQVVEFERAIRPALVTPKSEPCALVDIDGFGPTADRLEWRLREVGLEPRRTLAGTVEPATPPESALPESMEVAVIVGDYVLDPLRRGRWLRRDIPHLPIVFGDTSVAIGPFIEPGTGPCLYCLELHRTDADPAWPALASQLLGRMSPAQSPFVASEAATIATRLVLSRVSGGSVRSTAASPATAITVNADTGECHETSWRAHPECACAGLTAVAGPDLPETAKARSLQTVGRGMPTTKDEAVCVPA